MTHEHLSANEIIDYLHHELPSAQDARVLAHLESCAQCTAIYETEARLTDALRGYARATERELPQGVINRIWDAVELDAAPPTVVERLAMLLRPAILAPAAVALAAVIAVVILLRPGAATTTIDAAYYLDDHAALTSTVPFNEGMALPPTLERDSTATTDRSTVATTTGQSIAVYASR